MRELIRTRALELGFNECRFAEARPPASAAMFEKWLAENRHGDMHHLARNAAKRVDPQLVLEGVRSLIILGSVYPEGFAGQGSASGVCQDEFAQGEVARYARGLDYHDLLREPLRMLSEHVDELGGTGARSLWYVDTGPILERDFAQRAGLGFAGKHTNLVSRRMGNGFLLSEILTTLELVPDPPEPNRCGSCVRCIQACPTGAITEPFKLDARLCISYLTIELKGPIPEPLRPAVGARVFGCDDCLAVCPWNRFAQEAKLLAVGRRPELARLNLTGMLGLDDAGFKKLFAGTPMLRAKRRGFLRNICVALGNVGGRESIPALERAASDPEPLIAEHARWAVERILTRSRPGVF